MMPHVRVVVLLTFLYTTCSYSQIDSVIVADTKSAWSDAGDIFLAPVHFDGHDWLVTAAAVGGTALLFTADQSSRAVANNNHSQFGDRIFDFADHYGREYYGLVLSGGLYAGGLLFKNSSVRETGMMLGEAIVYSGIITNVIKSVVGRSRPYQEDGAYDFHGVQFKVGTTSLPSGHSTVAFAVSSVLSEKFNNTWASVGLYSLATLTAVSRVYHDDHWLSDTFLGGVIGTVVGTSVARFHHRREHGVSFRLIPIIGGMRAEILF